MLEFVHLFHDYQSWANSMQECLCTFACITSSLLNMYEYLGPLLKCKQGLMIYVSITSTKRYEDGSSNVCSPSMIKILFHVQGMADKYFVRSKSMMHI